MIISHLKIAVKLDEDPWGEQSREEIYYLPRFS